MLMRAPRPSIRWSRYLAVAAIIAALWTVALVPSGFGVLQLLMFAAPGMVLAVATSWAAHAFTPERWEWEDAFVAAVLGATAFPPFVALFVAWSATLDTNMMGFLFVLGSWVALAAGLVGGGIRMLTKRRRATKPDVAHIELLD
jgi:hypothetical protein